MHAPIPHSRCVEVSVELPSDAPQGAVLAVLVSVFGQQLSGCSVPVYSGIATPLRLPLPKGYSGCAISPSGHLYLRDYNSTSDYDLIAVFDSSGLRISSIDALALDVRDVFCFLVSGGDNPLVLIGYEDGLVALNANTLGVRWCNVGEAYYNLALLHEAPQLWKYHLAWPSAVCRMAHL